MEVVRAEALLELGLLLDIARKADAVSARHWLSFYSSYMIQCWSRLSLWHSRQSCCYLSLQVVAKWTVI